MKCSGTFLLFFLLLFRLSAQEHKRDSVVKDTAFSQFIAVCGQVTGGDGQELLPGAYIYLGEKKIAVTTTNEKGEFVIPKLPAGEIRLSVSYIGYEPFSEIYFLKADQDIGRICLQPEILEEVVVKVKPPLVVQRGDTTQFNASALKMAEDANLEDLLKKLPGFEMVDGKIMAQGKEVTKLCIDGVEYSFTDPAANLKNLPAELFAKVKMFDGLSEEAEFSGFDDGSRYRTLNLETHHPRQKKVFGNAGVGYGLTDPLKNTFKENNYRIALSGNVFNPGQQISVSGSLENYGQSNDLPGSRYQGGSKSNNSQMLFVNLSTKWKEKMSVSGSYRFSGGNNYSGSLSEQDYFPAEHYESRIYNRENHSWGDRNSHAVDLRIRYTINKKNTLTFSPTLSVNKNHSGSWNWGNNIENGDTINVSDVNSFSKSDGAHTGGEFMWMHAFQKKGRTLVARFNGQYSRNYSDEAQNNRERSLKTEGVYTDTLRNLLISNHRSSYSLNPSLTYSEPLTEHARFAFNYSYRENNDLSDKEALAYRDKDFEGLIGIDSSQTNQLENVYKVHNYGVSYQYHKDKFRMGSKLGMSHTRMENRYLYPGQEDSLTHSVYTDISPSVNLGIKLSEQRNLNLSYHGSSVSPNVTQLQNILNVANPLQVSKGNPDLKKSYNHQFSMDYNESFSESSVYWYSSLGVGQTFNQITSNVKVIRQDTVVNGYTLLRGSRLTSPVNLDGTWNMNLNMDCSFPWKKLKLRFNSSLSYNYSHTPSIYDDLKNFTSSHSGSLRVNAHSDFSEKLDVYLSSGSSYTYSNNTTAGGSRYFNESVNGSVRWIFWKGFFVSASYMGQFYINKKGETVRQNQHILNMGAGKKFGKKQLLELLLNGNDVLQEKNTMNYSLNDLYSETSYRTMPSTFYMLTLSYRFNNMNKIKQVTNQ